jgi:hypothetical protein
MRRDRFLAEKQQPKISNHVKLAAKVDEDELRRQIGELAGNEAGDVPEWDEELGMLAATVLFLKGPAGTKKVYKMEWMQWDHVLLIGYVQEHPLGQKLLDRKREISDYLERVRVEVLRQSSSAPEGEVISEEIKTMQNNSDWSLVARVQWTEMVESLRCAHDKCYPGSFHACSTGRSESSAALTMLRGNLHSDLFEFARTEVLDSRLKAEFLQAPISPEKTFAECALLPPLFRFKCYFELERQYNRKAKVRGLLYEEATRSLPGRPPCSTPRDTARLVAKILDLGQTMWADGELWTQARKQVEGALRTMGQLEPMDSRSPAPLSDMSNQLELVRDPHQLVAEAAVAANQMRDPRWCPWCSPERVQEVLRSYVNQKMQHLESLLLG